MTPTDRPALHRSILRFIVGYRAEHSYSPTVREVCAGVGLASSSTGAHHLALMERAGLVTHAAFIARTMRVTRKGMAAMEEES